MLKLMAVILLIAMFPIVTLSIILGLLAHPLFFLLLLLTFLALPAVMALVRRPSGQASR
jgi:hypothetical protein